MKNFIKSIRITIAFCILFSVCYVLILWVFGQFFGPGKGNAETITLNGKVVGAANVGQAFTKDIYFWGRPSAADYKADSSAGSNKGHQRSISGRSGGTGRFFLGTSSLSGA